jgi:hypothetical protein
MFVARILLFPESWFGWEYTLGSGKYFTIIGGVSGSLNIMEYDVVNYTWVVR